MVAEIVMRVPVDISIPPSTPAPSGIRESGVGTDPATPAKGAGGGVSDLDMVIAGGGLGHDNNDVETEAWKKWESTILKIIDVCKDYGLEELLCSACRVCNRIQNKCHVSVRSLNICT